MESISSVIRFINVDVPNVDSTTSTQTGDFLGIVFILLACIFVLCAIVFSRAKILNTNNQNYSSHMQKSRIKHFQNLKKAIIIFAVIASFMAILIFNVNSAFANNTNDVNANNGEIVTDDVINANVLQEDKIVTIDNSSITNNSNKPIKLSCISTDLLSKELNVNWTIKMDNEIVYDAKGNNKFDIEKDIFLNPSSSINISISTDIDFETANKLIDKDVLRISYYYDECAYKIFGKTVDSKGNPLENTNVQLFNKNDQLIQQVKTDAHGQYSLLSNYVGEVYLIYSNYDRHTEKSDLFFLDKNIYMPDQILKIRRLINFNTEGTKVYDEALQPIAKQIEILEGESIKFSVELSDTSMHSFCVFDNLANVYSKDENNLHTLFCPEQDLTINCLATKGLDYYTIEDTNESLGLKSISDDIATNNKNSKFYPEFITYSYNDEIWYSNSNGQQSNEVSADDPSSADVTKCNQNYRNNFQIDESKIVPENQELDRFLFLRVIGVNQDVEAFESGKETGKNAGITFQSIRSLPRAYAFSEDPNYKPDWWGSPNCFLRKDLSGDGVIFPNLSQPFKDNILSVSKKSQSKFDSKDLSSVVSTADKLFIPSYTEMCTPDTEAIRFSDYPYYYNGAEGQQYLWYQHQKIQGGIKATFMNTKIKDFGKANSGENISGTLATAHQRTTYYGSVNKFLLTNSMGYIYSYGTSFLQKAGIIPCFCFGTKSEAVSLYLNHYHCTITSVDGKELEDLEQVVKGQNFQFKIKKDEAYPNVVVKDNESIISPDKDGVYTIFNCLEDHNILAEGTGGPGDTVFSGTINIEKNLFDGKKITPRPNTSISFVNNDGAVLSSARSDSEGKYHLRVDSAYLGLQGKLATSYMPGVLTYESDTITLAPKESTIDVNLHGLDFYTLDELKGASNWLSTHKDDADFEQSETYKEFYSYVQNDVIWYSNSNGLQPATVNIYQSDTADPSLCNQEYKNSYVQGERDVDDLEQFLFMRIIGINHDEKSDKSAYAGLTLQTIHAAPCSVIMPKGESSWWGNSDLRPMLQSNGDFYKQTNVNITKLICPVTKYSQINRKADANISTTNDQMFLLSYSEMWNTNGSLVASRLWYGNTGASTEGHTYLWHKLHNIDGGEIGNPIFAKMQVSNSNRETSPRQRSWLRSIYFDNESYYLSSNSAGSIIGTNYDFSDTTFNVCFCL